MYFSYTWNTPMLKIGYKVQNPIWIVWSPEPYMDCMKRNVLLFCRVNFLLLFSYLILHFENLIYIRLRGIGILIWFVSVSRNWTSHSCVFGASFALWRTDRSMLHEIDLYYDYAFTARWLISGRALIRGVTSLSDIIILVLLLYRCH